MNIISISYYLIFRYIIFPYYFNEFYFSHFVNFSCFSTQIQKSKDFCKKLHSPKFKSSTTVVESMLYFRSRSYENDCKKYFSFLRYYFYFMFYLEGKKKTLLCTHTFLPVGIYLIKVNNKLLTLNIFHTLFSCLYC